MKQRKHKISAKKLRGEWAEMHFMVGWPGHFVAVQVKSTIFELEEGGYTCGVCGAGRKPYPPGSFDFLAAYVIWDDAWYIIPAEMILGQARVTVYPQSGKSKYAPYREAWHLLGAKDEDETIEINACADENFESSESERFNVGEGSSGGSEMRPRGLEALNPFRWRR